MAFRGSAVSRTLLSAARSFLRSSPPLARPARSPLPSSPLLQRRRLSLSTPPRNHLGELGCTMSLLPLHTAVAAARLTSHLTADARACRELSQGT